jgi:hypothetical protein
MFLRKLVPRHKASRHCQNSEVCNIKPRKLAEAVTFLICIRKVPGSNLGWDTD